MNILEVGYKICMLRVRVLQIPVCSWSFKLGAHSFLYENCLRMVTHLNRAVGWTCACRWVSFFIVCVTFSLFIWCMLS